jgi:hypothetical protein
MDSNRLQLHEAFALTFLLAMAAVAILVNLLIIANAAVGATVRWPQGARLTTAEAIDV